MRQWIELGQCLFVLAGAMLVAVGIWRAWTRPADDQPANGVPEAPAQPRARWSIRAELGRLFLDEDVRDYITGAQTRAPIMSPEQAQDRQTDQTDRQTDLESVADQWLDRLEVDKTRATLIELLVYSGWQTAEVRAVIKGDNGTIGTEVEAAKQRLGITDPPRMLVVREGSDERVIPM